MLEASAPLSAASPEPLLGPVGSLSLEEGPQPLMERRTSRDARMEAESALFAMRIDLLCSLVLREEIEQEPVERLGFFHRGEMPGSRDDSHAGTRDSGGVRLFGRDGGVVLIA